MEITFVDHGKPWKNHGIVFLNFCGNPDLYQSQLAKQGFQVGFQVFRDISSNVAHSIGKARISE